MMNARWAGLLAFLMTTPMLGCGEGALDVEYPVIGPDNVVTVASQLSAEKRRERARLIRDSAAASAMTNGVLLAGIAEAETNMAHCWSEATWACQGPASSSCGGGPVIAGSADGPCANRQGGLGMFQFDAGTHSQTLSREGRRVLTIQGNTQAAVEFVVDKVRISDFIPGVSTREQALTWLNDVRPDTPEWDQWIRTVTGYYNGCFEGRCSVFHSRYNNYDAKTRSVLNEFGNDFWYRLSGDGGVSEPLDNTGETTNSGEAANAPPSNSATPTNATPSRPGQLNPTFAEVPSGAAIALNWQSVSASTYTVRMEFHESGQWKYYYEWERSRSVFEVWPQIGNTSYRWQVRACSDSGCSTWSDWAHFDYGSVTSSAANTAAANSGNEESSEPAESEPPASSGPSGSSGNATSGVPGMPASMRPAGGRIDTPDVPLTWSEPMGATSYDIIMYRHNGSDWVQYYLWENKTNGAFTVWPVVDENYYAWAIRSCNDMGCSEWSDFQQFYFGGL